MRILVAIDGSESATRSVDLIASIPRLDDCLVRLVSVAPNRSEILGVPWGKAIPPDAAALEASVVGVHRRALDDARREIGSARADLEVEMVLARGRAASTIVGHAREMDADLVVVGHRGMGEWESRLLGSVSAEVVDHAPCPVLVVRDDQLGRVVLAVDGSAHAQAAEAVVGWQLFAGLPVTVATVALDAERHARTADCEAVVARLRSDGVTADADVRTGDPAHEIVACARELAASVIVIGSRGQTGMRRLVLGSVARGVLLQAPCSVLIVHDGAGFDRERVAYRVGERELVGAFG
jgi:nucleotide-binding universal stress UspA family protein